MHMSDALLSPVVGGVMLAASAAAVGFSAKKIAGVRLDEKKIPLMGIMGAFVFAGQMINFTIPGTGSSGHIGGGILLAALLGPYPALIVLASVLLIQCLFFADGGLLALGANIFNMGVLPCLAAYPLLFRPLARRALDNGAFHRRRVVLASLAAVVTGLLAGAFCVVLETLASGVTELPFGTFVLLMLPIHLAIGLGEGAVTAAVLCFVHAARPELLESSVSGAPLNNSLPMKKILVVFAALTVLVGGAFSIFASAFPDGLEWSMEKTAGTAELEREGPVYRAAEQLVETTAFMPDYTFKNVEKDGKEAALPEAAGTSIAGLAGSAITLALAAGCGLILHLARRRSRQRT